MQGYLLIIQAGVRGLRRVSLITERDVASSVGCPLEMVIVIL